MTRPMLSDTMEAEINQNMVLAPIRPMAAASSIWAMPATRVAKISGAMIILISRRKPSVTRPSTMVVVFRSPASI